MHSRLEATQTSQWVRNFVMLLLKQDVSLCNHAHFYVQKVFIFKTAHPNEPADESTYWSVPPAGQHYSTAQG
jgi:hypothetical protein